jgi:hypothetical protein
MLRILKIINRSSKTYLVNRYKFSNGETGPVTVEAEIEVNSEIAVVNV